jgi:hypothetical protein
MLTQLSLIISAYGLVNQVCCKKERKKEREREKERKKPIFVCKENKTKKICSLGSKTNGLWSCGDRHPAHYPFADICKSRPVIVNYNNELGYNELGYDQHSVTTNSFYV